MSLDNVCNRGAVTFIKAEKMNVLLIQIVASVLLSSSSKDGQMYSNKYDICFNAERKSFTP